MAGAATNCGTTSGTINPSMTPTTPNCPTVPPTVGGNNQVLANSTTVSSTPAPTTSGSSTAGTSSLPFTGADVGELAVIGGAALVAGSILMRRRRTATA